MFSQTWLNEDMLWTENEEDSYKDWMEVKVEYPDNHKSIQYDFRGRADGKEMMKKMLVDLIVQFDCGTLGFVP
jgi:hypothetical protein